jgi:Transposase IS4
LALDTLRIAKSAVRNRACPVVPSAYNLSTLFQFVTGTNLENAYQALNDVKATVSILCYGHFWQERATEAFCFQRPAEEQGGDDSSEDDNSVAGSAGSQSSEEDEEEEEPNTVPAGNRWEDSVHYSPSNPTPVQNFIRHFTSSNRSQRNKTGLQCNPIDVSTPIRAWRQIFTKTLLDKIVKYTNNYGEAKAKDWSNITWKDLEHFIAILFVTSIQKRKDKPSNWFSDNKLIECPLVKKIMSGHKFLTILRYLHLCEMKEQNPNDESYDPAYKVAEFRDYLEKRYTLLFIPGQQLSLDKTLIRAFGRIKFKVRIVSKAARYGIKVYVITDARTAFVLRVLIYTGRTTYTQTGEVNDHPMKTVQIVNKLVAPFVLTIGEGRWMLETSTIALCTTRVKKEMIKEVNYLLGLVVGLRISARSVLPSGYK